MDELDAALLAMGRWDGPKLAHALTVSLARRGPLLKVLALLETLLEHNVPADDIEAFKRWLLERLQRTGALLERRLSGLSPGGGMRFLLLLNALVVGLWQMADHAPATRVALSRPGLEVFQLDFPRELEAAVGALLRGLGVGPVKSKSNEKPTRRRA